MAKTEWKKKINNQVKKAHDILGIKQGKIDWYRQEIRGVDVETEGLKAKERDAADKKKRELQAKIRELQAKIQATDDELVTKLAIIDRKNAATKESIVSNMQAAEADFNTSKAKFEENLALPRAIVKVLGAFEVAFDAAVDYYFNPDIESTQAEARAYQEKRDELEKIQNMIEAKDTAAIVNEYLWKRD